MRRQDIKFSAQTLQIIAVFFDERAAEKISFAPASLRTAVSTSADFGEVSTLRARTRRAIEVGETVGGSG